MIIIIINHNLWKRIFEWPLRSLSNLVELFQVPPTRSTGCFPQCDTLYSQIQAVAQRPQSTEWNEAYNKLSLSSGLFFPVYNLWAKYKSFFIVHKKLRKKFGKHRAILTKETWQLKLILMYEQNDTSSSGLYTSVHFPQRS